MRLVVATVIACAVMIAALPASPWEFDEPLFFQGLNRYEPLAHHPPPPGYPLFMLAGRLVRFIVPSDFATLLVISFIGSAIGFVMLARAFRSVAVPVLFYLSPTMLVHSTLPISEPGALALLATALYFSLSGCADPRRRSTLFALFAALTVGWRIQFAIFVVPLFLVTVLMMKTWRDRLRALGVFTVVCLLWLVPLTMAVGGVRKFIAYETGQAAYLGAHDANESRSGWTPVAIAFRFIAHPWGTKFLSLPVLLLAAIGLGRLVRKRAYEFIPLLVAGACYIAFALWIMDPADGVRYAIPFTLVVAILAAHALPSRFEIPAAIVLAGAFMAYTAPVLWQRRTSPSPPIQAIEYARANFPANAVALYELPLWPHAQYFLADRNPHRVDDGLKKFFDQPDVPLFIVTNGNTSQPGAQTFRWPARDAYSKLTRNHYRVVSIIPVMADRRFKVIRNIHPPEREIEGSEWRWIESPGELQLPNGPAREVFLSLGLPARCPFERSKVTVAVLGAPPSLATKTIVERNRYSDFTIRVPAGAPTIRIESEKSFRPIDVPNSLSQDPRRLSVMLYDFRTQPAAAVAEPPAASPRSAPRTPARPQPRAAQPPAAP